MAFELSREVEKLCDFLEKRQKASYVEMTELVGKDVAGKGRYVLASARRRLERAGIFYLAERGVGVVRASNANVSALATSQPIRKVRRIARTAKKREVHVNLQDMSADDRAAHFVGRTVLNIVEEAVGRALRKKIQEELDKSDGDSTITLSQLVTLPRFKGGKK